MKKMLAGKKEVNVEDIIEITMGDKKEQMKDKIIK